MLALANVPAVLHLWLCLLGSFHQYLVLALGMSHLRVRRCETRCQQEALKKCLVLPSFHKIDMEKRHFEEEKTKNKALWKERSKEEMARKGPPAPLPAASSNCRRTSLPEPSRSGGIESGTTTECLADERWNRNGQPCSERPFAPFVAMPFAPSSFLFLVVRPGAPSSFLLLVA